MQQEEGAQADAYATGEALAVGALLDTGCLQPDSLDLEADLADLINFDGWTPRPRATIPMPSPADQCCHQQALNAIMESP